MFSLDLEALQYQFKTRSYVSTSVDIIKQLLLTYGGEWMAISVVLALPTRCVVLKDQVHTPTAAEIFGLSLEEQGTRYLQEFLLQTNVSTDWLGLSKCQNIALYKNSNKI